MPRRCGARPGADAVPLPVPASAPAPRPRRPRLGARLCYRLGALLVPNRLWRGVGRSLERHPSGYRALHRVEAGVKEAAFGCRDCGQCALPTTGYACPMTCPKELRNGPCGGVRADGGCEVFPEVRCVWLVGYERAAAAGAAAGFAPLLGPLDHRRVGESAWVNYWLERDGSPAPRRGALHAGAPR